MIRRTLDWFSWATLTGLILTAAACVSPGKVPPQAPPAVEVKVPVPVPCQIAQVPAAKLPAASADGSIFDLTKNALARLQLLTGENVRLRAANTDPCPSQ